MCEYRPQHMDAGVAVDLVVESGLTPGESVARDVCRMAAVRRAVAPRRPLLRVHALSGTVLSLGRYHLVPNRTRDPPVLRRVTGGRPCVVGDGFIGVSLVLPHRSALSGADPLLLAPAQVMNRCVRGILGACDLAGVPAIYPGRDLITSRRRTLGVCAFEVDASGVLLFEAVLAVDRDLSLLPRVLDAADPDGVVPAAMLMPTDTTSLAAELDRPVGLTEVAAWIARGYDTRLGLSAQEHELDADELKEAETLAGEAFTDEAWLAPRRWPATMGTRAAVATQLGTLEVRVRVGDGTIAVAVLAGDIIASSSTVDALEASLVGCPVRRPAIAEVVEGVLSAPEHFLLGIGPAEVLTDTIARAAGA